MKKLIFFALVITACSTQSSAPVAHQEPLVVEEAADDIVAGLQRRALLQPPAPLAADTRTHEELQQAACTGADHKWYCPSVKQKTTFGATLFPTAANPPASWSVPAWFVSPATGSDSNDCITSGTACKTKAQIFQRWGTYSPIINTTNVLITYLDNEPAGGNDPGIFTPFFVNGGTLKHFAVLPASSFTGTLLAVTPKARAANTALQSTFTTTTGAIVANLLLVNSTHPSRAFTHRNLGAGNWQITQPMVAYSGIGLPVNTEVDTWANGDTITGYVPISVDIATLGGQTIEFQNGIAGMSHIAQQMTIIDPQGAGFLNTVDVDGRAFPMIAESVIQRNYLQEQAGVLRSQVFNCSTSGFTAGGVIPPVGGGIGSSGPRITAGVFGTIYASTLRAPRLENDVIENNSLQVYDGTSTTAVFVDTNGRPVMSGNTLVNGSVWYGGGILNCQQGIIRYSSTAVITFPLSGGLQINGAANAYSNLTTAGTTAVHLLALTAANLDAAAGAAGFGGLAYVPGVGGFQQTTTTP